MNFFIQNLFLILNVIISMKIKQFWKKNRFSILGFAVGMLGGYLYWYYVGCLSGTCPLKKTWYYDAFLGGLIGLLIADIIVSIINKQKRQNNENN